MDSVRDSLFVCFLLCYGGFVEPVSKTWTHHTVLDGRELYHVYWSSNEDSITFKVEVATKGYVGFGLSPHGGMAGSDIVIGWVKDDKPYFQDRHGTGNVMPEIDNSQDWKLLKGTENDTHTILVFTRKLMTCDPDDLEIDESTMRVIYAFSADDPVSEHQVNYHGNINRGTRSIMLLQPDTKRDISVEGLPYWDVRSPNYTIPGHADTVYWCKILKGPQLPRKHHIVRINPLLQPGNEGFVHHVVLYECVGAVPVEYEPHLDLHGHQCFHPNMPDVMRRCEGVFAAWGVGGEPMVFPENVGMPLEASPPKYYMLEVHYDNPAYKSGITDESGFRIYYTSRLRKYDAASFMLGSATSKKMIIPPGQERFTIAGHSDPKCLGPVMPKGGVKLIGVFLHAHLLGRQLKARHFRKNKELPPLADDKNYDFNYQEYHYFPEEVNLLPEDQITVECTYNSKERVNTTFGGLSTKEEMCLAFILYYPKIERFGGVSVATFPLIMGLTGVLEQKNFVITSPEALANKNFIDYLTTFNWEEEDIKIIENATRYSPHHSYCYKGNGDKDSISTLISYPHNLEVYKKPSQCPVPEKSTKISFRKGGLDNNAHLPKSIALMTVVTSLWSMIILRLLY